MQSLINKMLKKIYYYISFIIYPLVLLNLKLRVMSGKENKLRFREKLGFTDKLRPAGPLIWFHAASIGEFYAILPVIKTIKDSFPSINILLTGVTITSAEIAQKNLPPGVIHQFAPLDCPNICNKFIMHWKPNLVIWTESEIWPNLLIKAQKNSKLLFINARISFKSYGKWLTIKSFAQYILSLFDLILAQSTETKDYLLNLGAKNVECFGNLKFVASNFNYSEGELIDLKNQLADKSIVMAASTHPGEEEMLVGVYKNLKIIYPNLFLIIAPRHPSRAASVLEFLTSAKINVITRSSNQKIDSKTDVFLIDTLGEFGLFYRLTEVVCMGGSWSRIGHSIIEPAKLDNLIIFGPNMDNSREVAASFLSHKAATFAKDSDEISNIIKIYLDDKSKFTSYKANAKSLVEKMEQVMPQVMEKITPYIQEILK